MNVVLSLVIATLLASTESTSDNYCKMIQIPAVVNSGNYATCPSRELLEMTRQNISAKVRELISGNKTVIVQRFYNATYAITIGTQVV